MNRTQSKAVGTRDSVNTSSLQAFPDEKLSVLQLCSYPWDLVGWEIS